MAKSLLRLLAAALLLQFAIPGPAFAGGFEARRVAGSVVYIAIADDQKQIGSGSGFIVAPGIVVTNFHVATAGTRLFVVPNGDTGKHAVRATVILKSAAHDLAILRAPDLKGRALTVAAGEPAQGVPIWAFGFPGLADEVSLEDTFSASLYTGTVARVLSGKTATGGGAPTRLVQHSALIAPGNSGGPLLDQCHRVVGINTMGVTQKESTFLYSVASSELPDLFRQAGVTANLSYDACGDTPAAGTPPPAPKAAEAAGSSDAESASRGDSVQPTAPAAAPSDEEASDIREREQERASSEAEKARQRAEAARAAQARAIAANDKAEAARQEAIARDAQKAADELDAYSQSLRKQLDAAVDPVERYAPIAIALVIALLLGGVLWLAGRRYAAAKRARDQGAARLRQREAEQAAIKRSDVTLKSPAGSLKLPGLDLERGVTIGRSSERSDVVLPNEVVSREHARFTRQAGRLYVYDLESANGVYINGSRIPPRQEREIRSGDKIGFGRDLTFIVEFS